MKKCPRCGREYPDYESFCQIDGTALAANGGTNRGANAADGPEQGAAQGPIECPVCGGKAEPGEVICNFCGTRLTPETSPSPPLSPSPPRGSSQTRLNPENYVPAHDRFGSGEIGDEPSAGPEPRNDGASIGRIFGVLGFSIAAIIALAAGAWFALYLSNRHPAPPLAQASPSPSASPSPAAAAAPVVELAKTMPIQVRGDLAGSLDRNANALHKVFEDNKAGLADAYKRALDSDNLAHDGMIVRLHIMPDGSVSGGAVRVSTASNPSLDAEVIREMGGWKFAPANGGPVDVDYPVIFAKNPSEVASIESDLSTKLASLGPNEAPEYALAPSVPASGTSPAPAAAATGAAPSPEMASAPSPAPPVVGPAPETTPAPEHRRRRRGEEMASTAPPGHMRQPPLSDRVATAISANRRLRHVQTYTNGGVVTLTGKVFDDDDRMLAERTARGVPGVTSVINDLTTSTQEWTQNQARITQELQNAGLTGVNVKVIGNSAYLSGQVKSDLDRQRAVTIAQRVAPVKVRENLITVVPGGMFGF